MSLFPRQPCHRCKPIVVQKEQRLLDFNSRIELLQKHVQDLQQEVRATKDLAKTLLALKDQRIEALEHALKPFARMAPYYGATTSSVFARYAEEQLKIITAGDIRLAQEILGTDK